MREFTEDNNKIFLDCAELSPAHCKSCNGFHLRAIVRRWDVPEREKISDGAEFQAAIALALAKQRSNHETIYVTLIGSTDTTQYVRLLNAAAQVGGEKLVKSLKVSLIDHCFTPLEICQRYAKSQHLKLDTFLSDFVSYQPIAAANLILMHGVVPFFPATQRDEYAKVIASWMAPGGMLISSTHLGTKDRKRSDQLQVDNALTVLDSLLSKNGLDDSAQRSVLQDNLRKGFTTNHSADTLFADADEATGYYVKAGLEVNSLWLINNENRDVGDKPRTSKQRAIAICTRPLVTEPSVNNFR